MGRQRIHKRARNVPQTAVSQMYLAARQGMDSLFRKVCYICNTLSSDGLKVKKNIGNSLTKVVIENFLRESVPEKKSLILKKNCLYVPFHFLVESNQ